MALDTTVSGATADSYLTVAEAELLVKKFFPSTDHARVKWSSLPSDDDREVYLRRAASDINRLRLSAVRTESDQALLFPVDGDTAVPQKVKDAQVYQALYLVYRGLHNQRLEMQQQGVRSISLGVTSETFYGDGMTPAMSPIALQLLGEWTSRVGVVY